MEIVKFRRGPGSKRYNKKLIFNPTCRMSRSDMSIVNGLKLDDREWITLWSSHRLVCAQTITDVGSSITMGISTSNADWDRTNCEQEIYLELKQNKMQF